MRARRRDAPRHAAAFGASSDVFGYISPGGYYSATPQPDPGQGLRNLSATLGDRARRDALFDRCMESKGYRKATAQEQDRIQRVRYAGRVGVRYEARDGALVVAAVRPGGPAERAGVRLGDRIIKVGGIGVGSTTSQDELTGLITGAPGSKVLLTVIRGSEEKDFVIVREILTD